MQTFLPYPDFALSAACLDRQRLGKQRVEVLQLLKALLQGGRWVNHPAARLWRGHEVALAAYGCAICDEWMRRGYRDTVKDKITALSAPSTVVLPKWFGDPDFHAAHRGNLIRKDPVYYGQFGWPDRFDLPYLWPEA